MFWRKGELFGLAQLLYIPCSLFSHGGMGVVMDWDTLSGW